MYLEENDYRDLQSIRDHCNRLMNFHVVVTMRDGSTFDGIIDSVDTDRVCILVGEDVMEQECDDQRQFFGGFGFPRRRFRRFRRRFFPFGTLAAISLLPFPIFPFF